MERIIIKHRKGSKANQTEIFTLKDHSEITFGREPSLDVHFDPADDWVSRKHASIQWDQTGNHFTIIDHNSRNGVFVNKRKIDGKEKIHHSDTIQFGTEGPEFIFELDPPPVIIVPPTREYQVETLPPTREAQQPPDYGYEGDSDPDSMKGDTADTGVYHRSVGRETVERLIYQNKSESRKNLINVGALLLGLVAIGIGYFIYTNFHLKEQLTTAQQDISTTHEMLTKTSTNIEDIKSVMPLKEIMERYNQATVSISLKFKLVHKETGKNLYQYHIKKDNRELPVYIEFPDGTIQPRLIVQDQRGTNELMNGSIRASGFLVNKQGFILTCRHIVEPWYSNIGINGPGVLYSFDPKTKKLSAPREREMSQINVRSWIPMHMKAVWIDGDKVADSAEIEGQLDKIYIVFAKTKSTLPELAHIVRISDEHDVALLKVDHPGNIEPVELNDNYFTVKAGDNIAVIGYPKLSRLLDEPEVRTRSKDQSRPDEQSFIRNPTIAPGVIGKILRGTGSKIKLTTGEPYEYTSPHDSYQLTITSLGEGTSGAPVFDDHGRVIGIFYSRASDESSSFTYAIPIKYGMDLMNILPVVSE